MQIHGPDPVRNYVITNTALFDNSMRIEKPVYIRRDWTPETTLQTRFKIALAEIDGDHDRLLAAKIKRERKALAKQSRNR